MTKHRWVRPKDKKVEQVEVPFTRYCMFPENMRFPDKPVKFMTIDEFIKESED